MKTRNIFIIIIISLFLTYSIKFLKFTRTSNFNNLIFLIKYEYYGIDSQQIEQLITIPLEQELYTLENVIEIKSTSQLNQSITTITFNSYAKYDSTYLAIRKITEHFSNSLPDEVQPCKILISHTENSNIICTSFNCSKRDLEKYKQEFENIQGVSEVIINGREDNSVIIEFSNLELANLIRFTDDKRVFLNKKEMDTINIFADCWDKKPMFDVYGFDLSTVESRKAFHYAWDLYFSKLSSSADKFDTPVVALVENEGTSPISGGAVSPRTVNLTELGDEGEQVVYNYEKQRVAAFNHRLTNKVLSLGKTKGLGYDIQSVIAEPGDMAEFVKYIEVKSTKRLTAPNIEDDLWIDTLNITRNEWIAAQQHRDFYSIFRVYFTREGITMFILKNPMQKYSDNKLQVTPMTYRLDFSNTAVDSVVSGL